MFSLEKKRLWRDLLAAFQYLKGTYTHEGNKLFAWVSSYKTKRNGFKLKEGRFKLDVRGKFFTKSGEVKEQLLREVVDALF